MVSTNSRLTFLDYLRGIAVIWMIEVHVVDVCLATTLKEGRFYDWLNISNGFVAVAFIFCAGAGFQLALEKKIDEYRTFGKSFWIYLRRLGHILLLAYWLHLPAFSLQRTLQASFEEWQRFADCDVLQTIVYSSLIALAIGLLIRNRRALLFTFAAISVFCFFSTIYVWNLDPFQSAPVMLAALVAKFPFSKFPLIPFSGYFFAGAVLTSIFVRTGNRDRFAKWGVTIGLAMAIVVTNLRGSAFDFPGGADWWHVSAGHALFRMSVVIVVLFVVFLFREKIDGTKAGEFLQLCGQESLFIYIFHLMLVYGTVSNFGLQSLAAHRWNFFEVSLVFGIVTTLSYSLASMWHHYKKNEPRRASRLIFVLIISFLLIFTLVPSYLTDR